LGGDADMDVLAPGPEVHPRLGGYLPGRQVRLPDLETTLPHGLQAGLADLLSGAGKPHVVPVGHSHVRGDSVPAELVAPGGVFTGPWGELPATVQAGAEAPLKRHWKHQPATDRGQ